MFTATENQISPSWITDHDHLQLHDYDACCHLDESPQQKLGLDGKRPRKIADKVQLREEDQQQMVKMVSRRRPISEAQSQVIQRVCLDCKATKTPLWRSGPAGVKSLCNACGIRYRKQRRKELEKKSVTVHVRENDKRGLSESERRFEESEETKAALLLMALSWS